MPSLGKSGSQDSLHRDSFPTLQPCEMKAALLFFNKWSHHGVVEWKSSRHVLWDLCLTFLRCMEASARALS